MILRQKIWLPVVLATNAAAWIIPSNVVELVARDRQTLLGRYSLEHFMVNIAVLMISAASLYIDWSTGAAYKKRWFRVIASVMVAFPALFAVDFVLRQRSPRLHHYRHDGGITHRPPNDVFHDTFHDRPEAHRTYPTVPPGYGTVDCTLNTDRRGFRNRSELERYDVLVLGDSFAEGSHVSDEHPWPVRLAERSGLTVYNLGMSGNAPAQYRASLARYGPMLRPTYVICMLYEGNDFRSARSYRKALHPSVSKRIKRYVKQSPLLASLEAMCVRWFGPINSRGEVAGIDILSWMPIAVPDGPAARYYAFAPKQLRCMPADRFDGNKRWFHARAQLRAIQDMCTEAGATLVVVFAPTKAHVVLPLVFDRLPADKVHAFASLGRDDVPDAPDALIDYLRQSLGGAESVVDAWCAEHAIPFLSATPALQQAAAAGRQVYYTYDQHWSPDGHEVVASLVADLLRNRETPAARHAAQD